MTVLQLIRLRKVKVHTLKLAASLLQVVLSRLRLRFSRTHSGNGLGLGGLKLFRYGHQKSLSDRPNPHVEGIAFFKDPSRGGGFYRMKMSICKSSMESSAALQVSYSHFMHFILYIYIVSVFRPSVLDIDYSIFM
jgi:hypothetical protein